MLSFGVWQQVLVAQEITKEISPGWGEKDSNCQNTEWSWRWKRLKDQGVTDDRIKPQPIGHWEIGFCTYFSHRICTWSSIRQQLESLPKSRDSSEWGGKQWLTKPRY